MADDHTTAVSDNQQPLIAAGAAVFLASLIGLFVELALIRWVSCEIRMTQ